MSVIFEWSESEMKLLLATCRNDDVWPLIQNNLPLGSRLLEAGCGAGRWVRFLSDAGYKITGLEYSSATVQMVTKVWPDIDVKQGDCEFSPFPDNFFDGVLSFGVVEHWVDGPSKPLADIYRVLKPGSIALITVPCLSSVRKIKRFLFLDEIIQAPRALARWVIKGKSQQMSRANKVYKYSVFPAWGDFFEYRMTPREFKKEIEMAGFEIKDHCPVAIIDGVYHELNPFGLLVKFVDWKFYPTWVARYLNSILSKKPFAHPHMQAIIARKP
jgi:SAM-dependent methyltransferase